MRSETMTMNQFMADMRRDLEGRLSGIYPGIRVEKQDVDKVQGESYRGLAIRRDDMQIAPVFNVEPLYAELEEQPYGSILNALVQKAVGIMEKPLNISAEILQDYDFMKGKLMAQVISVKDNAERLEQMPHRQMKDMAVIYRFMMGESPYGEQMTVAVTNAIHNGSRDSPEEPFFLKKGGKANGKQQRRKNHIDSRRTAVALGSNGG